MPFVLNAHALALVTFLALAAAVSVQAFSAIPPGPNDLPYGPPRPPPHLMPPIDMDPSAPPAPLATHDTGDIRPSDGSAYDRLTYNPQYKREVSGYANGADGQPMGTWWEPAGIASNAGSQGNFQTYTDQQRRIARGKATMPTTGSAVSRMRHEGSPGPGQTIGTEYQQSGSRSAMVPRQHRPRTQPIEPNLNDGREPSRYHRRTENVSSHESWWDSPGVNSRYGTSGNFKTFTDLQKDRRRGW